MCVIQFEKCKKNQIFFFPKVVWLSLFGIEKNDQQINNYKILFSLIISICLLWKINWINFIEKKQITHLIKLMTGNSLYYNKLN